MSLVLRKRLKGTERRLLAYFLSSADWKGGKRRSGMLRRRDVGKDRQSENSEV